MKEIKLTRGQITIVDNADYDELSKFKWFAAVYRLKSKTIFYAKRYDSNKKKIVAMHRAILGVDDSKTLVDHKDTDTLNNQRRNLRIATKTQNAKNRNHHAGCLSRYKGVSYSKRTKLWVACIQHDLKLERLGYFDDEVSAAFAYNNAAKKYHGEFARLNDLPLGCEFKSRIVRKKTSNFIGVSWSSAHKLWVAQVSHNKKSYVKYDRDEINAAIAYDKLAMTYKGSKAKVNFPNGA